MPKATPEQQLAEQLNLCKRASSMIDGYVNQPLRATIDTEQLSGPGDFRFQLETATQRARLLLSRSPVTAVLGGQYTAAGAFPATWTPIAANQFRIARPVIGIYGTTAPGGSGDGGQAVYLAPGIVTWLFGRLAYDVQVTYINGWPHTSLTGAVAAGATNIEVDDCTGWAPPSGMTAGACGTVYDGGAQEVVVCTAASATSGPGVLTLAQPLSFSHGMGVLVTTMPASVMQAAILFAAAQALTRGATATSVQALPGSRQGSVGDPDDLERRAKDLVATYRRVL